MTDVLLLPSAILVPDELRLDLGEIPTAMIPLHGKPILHHIVESYDDICPFIICEKNADIITEYIKREELNIEVIRVRSTDSLGETILNGLDIILEQKTFDRNDQLYINLSDTIVMPNQPKEASDFVSYAIKQNPIRWTCFEGDDEIDTLVPKLDPTATGLYKVFTGLFRLSDPSVYAEKLATIIDDCQGKTDPFYQALKQYLSTRDYNLIEAEEWLDVGHLDTYHQAKKQFMNVRGFNSLDTNEEKNQIKKSSEKAQTLRAEYNWYANLPDNLKGFSPSVLEYDENIPSLELEYIGYPTLRDLHLHSAHGLHIWNQIFDTLFSMLDTFGQHRTSADIQPALKSMYLYKTERRLSEIDQEELLRVFNQKEIIINEVSCKGLPIIRTELESVLREFEIFKVEDFTVIHGDLHFSNILFDLRNSLVKLIDPRGEFGTHTIYGDQRYDLAKLRHSVAGGYDFIINDMFNVTMGPSNDTITYEIYTDKSHRERQQLFDRLLAQKYPTWFEDIKLIESLLFLSMVPLHNDNPARQQFMLAHGIKQFNNLVDL